MNWPLSRLIPQKILSSLALAVVASAAALAESSDREQPQPRRGAADVAVFRSYQEMIRAANPKLLQAVPLTRGPKYHWFSFYDLLQFDPTGRYVLGMEIDFEQRRPKADDEIAIGLIDLENGNRWREIGRTTAWCWQLGCRLQWRRGSMEEVLWNERQDGRYVCRIYNIRTGKSRIIPRPIYNMAPDGRTALSYDFERVAFRGYGFDGIPDRHRTDPAPESTGLYKVDLETGDSKLIISLARIAALRQPDPYPADPCGNLYFVQGSWNPSGSRFMFFSRRSLAKNLGTVVFTSDPEGSDIRRVDRDLSHYEWADDQTMLFWKNEYRLYQDDGTGRNVLLFEAPNGHQTYLPGREWVLTDTYPDRSTRIKHLYLYHIPTKSFVPLARLATPNLYPASTEFRNDLHPRLSPDGRRVVVDSVHAGNGRQMYIFDIAPLLREKENR